MRHLPNPRRVMLESSAVFAIALAILLTLAPAAPFTKELGVCESGAVRDVLAGNILLPRFIPGPIVHVPPLYWWLAAFCVRLLGWSELAFRLPALVPAALTCTVVYGWALPRLGREAAFWGAAVLFFGHHFLDAARQPRMDAMLTMFVTVAVVALERAVATRTRTWFMLAASAIGLGCLTKGILGIALPGSVITVYLLTRRRFRDLVGRDLVIAFAAGLAIGLAWYVAGYEAGGGKFLQWQIRMNLWSRFVPAAAGGANYCVHPIWYFAPQVIVGILPWSLYLPALALACRGRPHTPRDPSVIYTLCWFAAVFGFFSLSRGKCQVYILPALPPLALLIGWAIAEVSRQDSTQPPLVARFFGLGSMITALGAGAMVAAATGVIWRGMPSGLATTLHPTDRSYLVIFATLAAARHYGVLNWLVISTLGVLVVLRGLWRGAAGMQAFGVLILAVAGARFWFGVMAPAAAEKGTLKRFAYEVGDEVPSGARIGHIGIEDCALYFYSPRPIDPVFHFQCGADSPQYLVMRKSRLAGLPPTARACLRPILESESVDSNGPRLLLQRSGR